MREAEDLGAPAALRKLIVYYLDLFEKNGAAINLSPEAIVYAKYALVAMLDETVLSIPGPCRDYWLASPLQLEYFGDNIAGEEFFRKLDKLLLEPDKMVQVLGLYYICLSLGFEGKYKLFNAEERVRIIDTLGRQLGKLRQQKHTSLSPHGQRVTMPAQGVRLKPGRLPLWAVGVIGAAVLVVGWVVLAVVTNGTLQKVLQLIS
jgi:type VI secretion system protein ImpK